MKRSGDGQLCAAPDGKAHSVPLTLEADAAERVLAGMEMIHWETPTTLSRQLVDAWAPQKPRMQRHLAHLGRDLGLLIAFGFAGLLGGIAGAGFGIPVAAFAGPVLGVGLGWGVVEYLDQEVVSARRTLLALEPPPVLLTSTGMVFGDIVRQWNGRRSRLVCARLHTGPPAYLELRFAGTVTSQLFGRAPVPLCLPVPVTLIPEVTEIVVLLNQRLESDGLRIEQIVGSGEGQGL